MKLKSEIELMLSRSVCLIEQFSFVLPVLVTPRICAKLQSALDKLSLLLVLVMKDTALPQPFCRFTLFLLSVCSITELFGIFSSSLTLASFSGIIDSLLISHWLLHTIVNVGLSFLFTL